MDVLFDVKTLIASNAALSFYIASWLLLYKINQKTYSGYELWMTGAFFVAIVYILLYLSDVLPPWCLIFVHVFITLTEVLRLDSISRFTTNQKITKRYYWLPVIYVAIILYFSFISVNALVRNLLLGIFSFVIIMLTSAKLFKNITKKNKTLYIATGLIYSMYGGVLLSRSFAWLINPPTGLLSSEIYQQLYLFLLLIFETGLGIAILMMNSQRLELDLMASRDNLQETVLKLQAAMDEVKTLSGLLPICASCKKIRDDKGYWSQIDMYIQEHSEIKFSHGICPECMQKLYPEEYADMMAKKK
jgi:hypothetical protein